MLTTCFWKHLHSALSATYRQVWLSQPLPVHFQEGFNVIYEVIHGTQSATQLQELNLGSWLVSRSRFLNGNLTFHGCWRCGAERCHAGWWLAPLWRGSDGWNRKPWGAECRLPYSMLLRDCSRTVVRKLQLAFNEMWWGILKLPGWRWTFGLSACDSGGLCLWCLVRLPDRSAWSFTGCALAWGPAMGAALPRFWLRAVGAGRKSTQGVEKYDLFLMPIAWYHC